VILFTSGSEGLPKGVELTHANLLANLRQMLAMLDIVDTDRSSTPCRCSTASASWPAFVAPLVRGVSCFLYPSPLHYRIVLPWSTT
jgi:acyl-[acyl-carrier-protein]-phospholipid O-acyltransferase/long-chain-fatty-acid--[acyl-carrier-protein] ligase